jgi:hypothetical protein
MQHPGKWTAVPTGEEDLNKVSVVPGSYMLLHAALYAFLLMHVGVRWRKNVHHEVGEPRFVVTEEALLASL